MGYGCVGYSCHNNTDNKKDAGRVIHFHKFPLENEQLCTKWVIATKLEDFVPKGHHFLCSDHFTRDDYFFENSSRLKHGAVPSEFSFPPHLMKHKPQKKKIFIG